ncbi:MAG: pullulanase-associated domain-containing protein, partial [Bacillota bacterium]|nr:pullulanase-associated domain-containing protein [Bacillota bacterium]
MLKLRKRLLFLVALLFGVAGQLGEKAVSGKAPESRLESRPKDQAVLDSNSVTFHYHRSDSSYSDYDLWIWGTGENGAAHALSQSDDFGKYAVINLSNYRIQTEINVLIRQGGGSWTRQSSDLNIQLSDYTPIGTMYHVYLVNMESEVFASAEDALKGRVTAALFKNEREITATTNNEPETYKVLEGLTEIKTGNVTWTKNSDGYSYDFKITLPSDFIPAFDKDYEVEVKFKNSADTATRKVGLDGLFDSELFESKLVYNGKDLGNNYSQTETTFKAWSPFSTDLKLRIYDNGTPVDVDATLGSDEYAEYDMVKGDKGVWSYTLSGDLHGKYYT